MKHSEQVPTNQVSLDDLKRAIARLQQSRAAYEANKSLGWDIESDRAEAWRTAFEWRNGWVQRYWDAEVSDDQKALELEEIEGVRLIREKLR